MGPELDLYLLPEDKGLKITTMGREKEWGKSRESTPGKSSRLFRGKGRKEPNRTPGGRNSEHEEEAKEDEQSGKQCLLFTIDRRN